MAGAPGVAAARFTLASRRAPDPCHVVAGVGLLERLPALLDEHAPATRYVLVSDDTVAPLHGRALASALEAAGRSADLVAFPAGERHKTVGTWARVLETLADRGVGRDACLVAVGGGVTADLAGFVAATYARGLPLVQVPTSLLAMVDAAVGGKTAIDLEAGKNLVGAFHQPRLVVVDPAPLDTLPDVELVDGFAEALKHGLIADPDYLDGLVAAAPDLLRRDPDALLSLIVGSLRIKTSIVERDPFEDGERAALNFGHTIAHGLERATDFRLRHGHAVAIGMRVEARLGETAGVSDVGCEDAVRAALSAFGLPSGRPPHVRPEAVLRAARRDKKNRGGVTRYALIRRPGTPARGEAGAWTWAVGDDLARAALHDAAAPAADV